MSVRDEWVERLVGQWARPVLPDGGVDRTAGPYKVTRAWAVGNVVWVALETPDGERELKAHTCFITKTRGE